MIETNYNSSFPTQTVSDEEKASIEYGLKVGRAIEHEWFGGSRTTNNRFSSNFESVASSARTQPLDIIKVMRLQ